MNEGLLSGVEYGAPLKAYRKRVKLNQGASQYLGDAVVLGTSDNITGQTTRSQGGAPQTYRQDFVIQVPVTKGLKGNPLSSTAISLTIPDGNIEGGNLRGTGAIDLQYYRDAATKVASGTSSVALGGNNTASGSNTVSIGAGNLATGNSSTAIGDFNSTSGVNQVAIGKSNATQISSYTQVAIGESNTINNAAAYGVGIGKSNSVSSGSGVAIGVNNTASGITNSVAIGSSVTASGDGSISIGNTTSASAQSAISIGRSTTANSLNSFATGCQSTTSGVIGKRAHATGQITSLGDNQYGRYLLKYRTTDATLTPLTTNGSAYGATNVIVLPNYSVFSFFGYVTAFRKGSEGVAAKVFKVEGAIRRGANAADTVLVGTPTISTVGESSALGYSVGCSADTTNGALWIYATGTTSHSVQWVANIETVENTYA